MQFLTFTRGGSDLIFPDHTSFTVDFMFPQPAQTAEALIQGFDFAFQDPDHHLERIEYELETHFGAGDRSGTIEVSFALSDETFKIISAEIRFLVIGQ
jgi:hypothetical protein